MHRRIVRWFNRRVPEQHLQEYRCELYLIGIEAWANLYSDASSNDMDFHEEWKRSEQKICAEAHSLGDLFGRLKSFMSQLPISDAGMQRLYECAVQLPASLAGYPLLVGHPVDAATSPLVMIVSVLEQSEAIERFHEIAQGQSAANASSRISRVLRMVAAEAEEFRTQIGNRLLLQYEIWPTSGEEAAPWILFYPRTQKSAANNVKGGSASDLSLIETLINRVFGELDRRHFGEVRRLCDALEAGQRLGAIGFSQQNPSMIRLTILGYRDLPSICRFLRRVDHKCLLPNLTRLTKRLTKRQLPQDMQFGLQMDIAGSGNMQRIEVQIFSASTIYSDAGWFKDNDGWQALIAALQAEKLVSIEKLEKLLRWSSRPITATFGRSGMLALFRRIHHFALEIEPRAINVNAYAFLMLSPLGGGNTSHEQ